MRVVAKALHELLGGFVEHGVMRDVMHPTLQLTLGGQFAVQKQIGDFEICAVFGENFDGITAVAQDPLIAVDIGDRAFAGSRIHERRIVGHQAEIVSTGLDLAQVHRANRPLLDGESVALSGSVVGNGQGILRHPNSPEQNS